MSNNDMPRGNDASAIRRKLLIIRDDIREIRDQGKKAMSDAGELPMFKGMFSSLDSSYASYSELYYSLCDISDSNGEAVITASDHSQRNTVKRYMQEANTQMISIKDCASTSRVSDINSSSCCPQSRARAKLPTIPLIKFSGDRTKWPRFRDLFESLVIGDDQLHDIDKYHYLLSSLQEPASAVIAKLPITETNFTVAWQALKEVYDNQRLLAGTYLDQLLDLKTLQKKPSSDELSNRIAVISEVVSAVKLLNIPDFQEFLFFHIACRSLDPDTRLAFENANDETFPKFEGLISFLRKRSNAAALALPSDGQPKVSPLMKTRVHIPGRPSLGPKLALITNSTHSNARGKRPISSNSNSRQGNLPPCHVCGDLHLMVNCAKLSNASPEMRQQMIKGWQGCRNCLQMGHWSRSCPSKWRCRFCKSRHHSLLHLPNAIVSSKGSEFATAHPTSNSSVNVNPTPTTSKPTLTHHAFPCRNIEIMLGTALCRLGTDDPSHIVRLVIDSGSHSSFVTRECALRIGLNCVPHNIDILGIGETPLHGFKGQAYCTLSSLSRSSPHLSVNAIVVDSITQPLPGFETSSEVWEPYMSYELADPQFWVTRPVDFLLGCDLFSDILTGQIIDIQPGMPKLIGTIFGLSVLGRVQEISEATRFSALCTQQSLPSESLNIDLQRFWKLEEPPAAVKGNPHDMQCEKLFVETHSRLPDGRYVVKLPFTVSNPYLPGSKSVALKRLTHLENKLSRNSNLRQKYHHFMQEYIQLNHMSVTTDNGSYVIPHHCVVKGDDHDMKVRVVFDAASQTPNGSLNDFLMVGPKLQADIVVILLNFRLPKYVFTTDAVKMFRQIIVAPEDRRYQHILWRFDTSKEVREFELSTVSYGQSCAPYLAHRVVRQLIADEGELYPLAARTLSEDMYVDDIASGADTLPLALNLVQQVVKLMAKGGFSLSKWAANHSSLLEECCSHDPDTACSDDPVSLESSDDNHCIKILGLHWDPRVDMFTYKITYPTTALTKRGILSAIARIYDPLGLLGPIVIVAKLILQTTWKRNIAWDEHLPSDLVAEWTTFIKELPMLEQIKIPRRVIPDDPTELRLLIFADASEKAYCASAYLHTVSPCGSNCHLVLAKTKLAPLKTVSIPRLELCAALLAGRLRESLEPFYHRLPFPPTVLFFTDSTVVLAWLRTPSFKLKTFVANRVEMILELSKDAHWYHVLSPDNPSDLGSRGVPPTTLVGSSLWYHGPSWAQRDPSSWPLVNEPCQTDLPDLKAVATNCVLLANSRPTVPWLIEWIERFSSFNKLIHSFAYALRFINRLKQPRIHFSGTVSLSELRYATTAIVKVVQGHLFFNAIPVNPKQCIIPKSLISLNPFFDQSGVLLVGGRLSKASIPWNIQHPIILPTKSHLSTLLIDHYHRLLLHPGSTLLLATLRLKYWVIGARKLTRHLARTCVKCRRYDAPLCQPKMGELPECRFQEGRAFLHVGVDFAGPFLVKESSRRRAPQYKCYLCLFICLSSRALHLEAVTSLSTEAFLAALRRFVGRRGLPEKIYSDNGTNFVGAYHHLKDLYAWFRQTSTQDDICSFLAEQDITWSFNPPAAPSFGGSWEAGVKSVKRLMRSVYGECSMTLEQLSTLFIEIERILNSRPLCPLTSDPNDLSYLSPGHLLIGSSLLEVPTPTLYAVPDNRLSQWEIIHKKSQHFWRRWRHEYISTLQERVKWKCPEYNIQPGDLVLVKDEASPRYRWPLARVSQVHPGKDDIVRVVTLKIHRKDETREFKRPVNKLVPLLPLSDCQANSPALEN